MHKFWNNQPTIQTQEEFKNLNINNNNEPINANTDIIKKEPYILPNNYEWIDCDLNDKNVMQNVYHLLSNNYVEDNDKFRFNYSIPFLKWTLMPPGYLKECHLGVRVKSSKLLVGFISGIPQTIKIYDKLVNSITINFLCVHKQLRSKRLTPILIKEITRRANNLGIFQALYTSGTILPTPIGTCQYYHRYLNTIKLIKIGFCHLKQKTTYKMMHKLYDLLNTTITKGLREISSLDIPQIYNLLNVEQQKYNLAIQFTEEELYHWLITIKDVIYCYVVENDGIITDFISFYCVSLSVLNNEHYSELKTAYLFYNVQTKINKTQLINDCLILAKNIGCDVFNCLDIQDNSIFLKDLKFVVGTGKLNYYLYNWKCPFINSKDISAILM